MHGWYWHFFSGFSIMRGEGAMKKILFIIFSFTAALGLFAQTGTALKLSSLGLFPFEASDGAAETETAALVTRVVEELRSWGTLTVLAGAEAEKAEYTVKGRLSRQGGQLVLSAVTYDAKQKELNSSKEQAPGLNDFSARIFSFCAQLTENVPFPNYLLGTWQSVLEPAVPDESSPLVPGDGPLVCIIEFQTGQRVLVKQFDTYEQKGSQSLKYEAIGTGTYSYWGHARRNIGGLTADATFSLSVSLEDALPKYGSLNASRMGLAFDEEKKTFEMGGAGLPCGDKPGGKSLSYDHFTKIP
jgi:hypothetical protein